MNTPPPTIIRDVADNRASLLADMADAALKSGRQPDDVMLIAVAKRQPLDRIERALNDGQRVFGENRLQEAQSKWPALLEQ